MSLAIAYFFEAKQSIGIYLFTINQREEKD